MDLRLSIEDHKRVMFWYHLAFKKRNPSDGDDKTMIKIQNLARIKSETGDLNKRHRK